MDAYVILWLFFIDGLLGVVIETLYCSIWVSRGVLDLRMALLYLPFNPLYGCAGVVLTLALTGLAPWPILVFIIGLAMCTTLEYAVGAGLERAFGMVTWDYFDKPLNLHGRICLQSAVTWGLLSMLLIYVIDPLSIQLISTIPRSTGETVLGALIVATAISTVLTLATFGRVRRRITASESARRSGGSEAGAPEAGEAWGDHLLRQLAPDPVLYGSFSKANLIVRYRNLNHPRAAAG